MTATAPRHSTAQPPPSRPAAPTHDDRADPLDGDGPSGPSRRRFWVHSLLLLVALLGISAVIDNGYPASADEGAVLAQVDVVARGSVTDVSSWRIGQWFPELDPTGEYTPLENSSLGTDHYLPYAKHALYPVLLLPTWGLLGEAGAVAWSAIALWCAALAAAAIARRLRADLVLPTMWLVALGSPLLLDGAVVMAHALGAALLGALVVCVLRHLERPSVVAALGAMTAAAALTLVRSEGLLAVAALCVVLGLMSLRRSDAAPGRRRITVDTRRMVTAVAICAAAAVAHLGDTLVAARLVGTGARAIANPAAADPFIGGRISAFWITLLRPTGGGWSWAGVVLFVSAALVVLAALVLRAGGAARRRLAVGCLVAAALLSLLAQLAPPVMVSGLLVVFPAMVFGLVWLRSADLRSDVARLCLGTSALAAGAIWVTTYSIGGGVEWGGRFFHLLLPLVVPFAVLGLARAWRTMGVEVTGGAGGRGGAPRTDPSGLDLRRVALGAGLVVTVSLSLLSLRAAHELRVHSRTVVETGLAAADAARPAADGGAPVLVTDVRPFARAAWRSIDDHRMFRVPTKDRLDPLLDGLADAEVGTVTVMTSPLQPLPDDVGDRWQVVGVRRTPGSLTEFVELRQR